MLGKEEYKAPPSVVALASWGAIHHITRRSQNLEYMNDIRRFGNGGTLAEISHSYAFLYCVVKYNFLLGIAKVKFVCM